MDSRKNLEPEAASPRLSALAWSLFLLVVVFSVTAVALSVALRPHPDADVGFAVGQGLLGIGYAAIGAVVAARAQRNACGWILLAIGLLQSLSNVTFAFGLVVLGRPGLIGTLGLWAEWFGNWIWFPSLVLLATFLPLLFPNGRLPSPPWRWLGRFAGTLLVGGSLVTAIQARLYLQGNEPSYDVSVPLLLGGLLVGGVFSVASLVVRYRRSEGIERQQLKLIGLGGAAAVVGVMLTFGPTWALWPALTMLLALPAAVGGAILRYRLFDIDRIISRTVSYVMLTGLLAAVYAGGVVVLRPILALVTGESSVSVALSTIAVAALFGPARRRIQSAVDRRFNRERYDAALVVDAFNARLRDQVELDELNDELLTVVAQTLAPAGAILWFRQAPAR